MTAGRNRRLLVAASLLAMLFAFATIAHARVHLGAERTETAACTFCQHATDSVVAVVQVEETASVPETIELVIAPRIAAPMLRSVSSRGPPAA